MSNKKTSRNKNKIRNSFTLNVIFFQPAKIQIGVKNVVSIIKNKEIPSSPKIKLIPKKDNHFV
jgi:hypothetical protein